VGRIGRRGNNILYLTAGHKRAEEEEEEEQEEESRKVS